MNTMTVRKWDEYLVGVFTEDWDVVTPAIVNKNDVVQFYLKILSPSPNDFPKKVKNVTCYANLLTSWGFEDKRYNTNVERTEYLREFLRDNLVVFQPEQRNDFVIARDISLIPKSEAFSYTSILRDVPLFQGYERQEFERKCLNKEFLHHHPPVTHNDKEIEFVVLEEASGELFLCGPIEYVEKKEEGIRFYSTKQIECIPFQDVWLTHCSRLNDTLYISDEVYSEIVQVLNESTIYTDSKAEIDAYFPNLLDCSDRECKFISTFEAITKKHHFHYDLKDLINFHTSLKSSNLVILSGMSGTGKSKLVSMYGEALGLGKGRMLSIKVRPSWIDDSDLIGYLDVVNSLYYSGDSGLVELLMEAEHNQDKMYLVCFEEMNLARVEHYFSQFLSILEGEERVLTLYHDHGELQSDVGYPSTIKIGRNVLFVGTVNIDESTHVFSDKVLDRANLITLNVMPFYRMLNMKDEPEDIECEEITSATYALFCDKPVENELTHRELSCLWDIHNLLQEHSRNFGIGWRIIHQMNNYLRQLPSQDYFSREMAFDIQLLQRVFPKMRGSEAFLKDIVGEYNMQTGVVERSQLLRLLNTYQDISNFSLARKGIVQKAKEIKINGFTI